MSSLSEALARQIAAEAATRGASSVVHWDPLATLSPQQALRYSDVSRFKAIPAGRRSGKTNLLEKVLLGTRNRPGQQAFYVSTSIKRAVATIWDELVLLNADDRLGGDPNLTTHTMRFPGGGMLTVTGVEDKTMANDLRGRPRVWTWLIDECQDWKDDLLRYFYNEVVYYSLADVRGEVWMSGTGGAPDGFWHEVATKLDEWKRFAEWTPLDNPFLAEGEAAKLIAKACADRGCDLNDPSIQREFFARFCIDTVRQIFPYNDAVNGFNRGTWDVASGWWKGGDLPAGKWSVVLAGDFGTVDATAWAALGWTDASPFIYVLETDEQETLGSGAQAALMQSGAAKYERYLVASVGDPGGGGKGVMVDLRHEHYLAMEVAMKTDKAAACVTMRGALRSGKLKVAREESANLNRKKRSFIQDLQRPEWDPNAVGTVTKGHFPDKVDATLYGYRKAAGLHHYTAPPPALNAAQAELQRVYEQQQRELAAMRDWQ